MKGEQTNLNLQWHCIASRSLRVFSTFDAPANPYGIQQSSRPSYSVQFASFHNFPIHPSRPFLFLDSFPFFITSHNHIFQPCAVAGSFLPEPNFPMHVSEDHREKALDMQVHLAGLSTSKNLHYARNGPCGIKCCWWLACLSLFSVLLDSVVWMLACFLLLPLLPSSCSCPHLASSLAPLRMWVTTYGWIIFF